MSDESRYIPRSAFLLFALMMARALTLYSFYLYDDAFITFRYAANLAAGNGFVYNIGERVQGISAPLWGLLLALPHALGLSIEWAARLLGILFDAATALIVYRWFGREGFVHAGAILLFLFALDPYLAKQSVGGMESSMFLLATIAAVVLCLKQKHTAAALLAAASCFVRPEGLLFCAVLFVFLWIEQRKIPLKPLLVGSAIVAAGVLAQNFYYGDLIPASVCGKMALARSLDSVWNLALFPLRDPLQFLLTITTIIGLPFAWRTSRFVRIYAVWAFALLAVWIVTGAHLWPWYCVPFWFFKLLVSAVAFDILLQHARLKSVRVLLRPTKLAVLVIAAWAGFAMIYSRDRMETNVYSRIRDWAAGRDFTGQSAYGMDFGAFGYYTGLRILDEPGLVWPAGREVYHSDLRAILLSEKPDWAWVTRCGDNMRVMKSAEIEPLFRPLWRASMQGDTTLDFAHDVAPLWAPDFVLYRRLSP